MKLVFSICKIVYLLSSSLYIIENKISPTTAIAPRADAHDVI